MKLKSPYCARAIETDARALHSGFPYGNNYLFCFAKLYSKKLRTNFLTSIFKIGMHVMHDYTQVDMFNFFPLSRAYIFGL